MHMVLHCYMHVNFFIIIHNGELLIKHLLSALWKSYILMFSFMSHEAKSSELFDIFLNFNLYTYCITQ